jgi:hypothetical protein
VAPAGIIPKRRQSEIELRQHREKREAQDRRRQSGIDTKEVGPRVNRLGAAGEKIVDERAGIECFLPQGLPQQSCRIVLLVSRYSRTETQPTPLKCLDVQVNGLAAEKRHAAGQLGGGVLTPQGWNGLNDRLCIKRGKEIVKQANRAS